MKGDSAVIRAADTAAIAVLGVKLLGVLFAPLEPLLPPEPLLRGLLVLLLYLLRLGLPLVACVWLSRPVPVPRRRLPPGDCLVYCLAAVGVGLCANYLSAAAVGALSRVGFVFSAARPEFTGGLALVVELLAWTLFPALLEELFFRGAVFGLLAPFGELRATLLSALLFALCHATVGQLLPAFVMGLMFAWLRAASGGVLWCVAAHLLYNSLAAAVALLGGGSFVTFVFGAFALIVVIVKSGAFPALSGASGGSLRRSFWLWASLIVMTVDVLAGISLA